MSTIEYWKSMKGYSTFSKLKWCFYKALRRDLLKRGVIYGNGALRIIKEATQCDEDYLQPKKIVCITGFGHSGSGAVVDLLSEYACNSVEGFVDHNCSLRKNSGREFDILRHAGGLFSLEDAVQNPNPFIQDACVKLFMALVATHYDDPRCSYKTVLVNSARRFLDVILDYSLPGGYGYDFCPHLDYISDRGYDLLFGRTGSRHQAIFFLKNMSVDAYRLAARGFVSSVLGKLASGKVLVLDQIVSDGTADMQKYEAYLDNMKLIAVWRDPRDVFVTAKINGVSWIPHEAKEFSMWYRRISPYFSMHNMNYKLIRFEKLVHDYRNEVSSIEDFLGLDPNDHVAPKTAFNPDVSSVNVGIYRQYLIEFGKDIKVIEKNLEEFLSE